VLTRGWQCGMNVCFVGFCGVSVRFTAGHKKVVPMRTHWNSPSIVNTKALRTGAAHHPGEVVVFSCSNHWCYQIWYLLCTFQYISCFVLKLSLFSSDNSQFILSWKSRFQEKRQCRICDSEILSSTPEPGAGSVPVEPTGADESFVDLRVLMMADEIRKYTKLSKSKVEVQLLALWCF
jgi:hypothetical protein